MIDPLAAFNLNWKHYPWMKNPWKKSAKDGWEMRVYSYLIRVPYSQRCKNSASDRTMFPEVINDHVGIALYGARSYTNKQKFFEFTDWFGIVECVKLLIVDVYCTRIKRRHIYTLQKPWDSPRFLCKIYVE